MSILLNFMHSAYCLLVLLVLLVLMIGGSYAAHPAKDDWIKSSIITTAAAADHLPHKVKSIQILPFSSFDSSKL